MSFRHLCARFPRIRYRGRAVGTSLHSPVRAVLLPCSFKDKRTKETKDLAIEKYVLLFFCLIKKTLGEASVSHIRGINATQHVFQTSLRTSPLAYVVADVPLVRPYLSPTVHIISDLWRLKSYIFMIYGV